LSAACDKREGLNYFVWKIVHSRWTVVLQFECSALKLTSKIWEKGG